MLTAPLPPRLDEALAALPDSRETTRASADLSRRYRDGAGRGPVARSPADVRAYAAARLPATYAAVAIALDELRRRLPSFAPATQLDLGACPGTAVWAAAELWPELDATAVEPEAEMRRLARDLGTNATWVDGTAIPAGRFDLVTASYVLGELDDAARAAAVEHAWAAAAGALVVVEPGTPAGYERVLDARDRVVGLGGTIVAPCPHDRECPLASRDDWCHFAVRVARSRVHRRAKDAQLAHEDEKFSYVVLAPDGDPHKTEARVLRHPQIRPGHVLLELCAADGLRGDTVSKRAGDEYRLARKLSWGDGVDRAAGRSSTET